VIIVPIEYTIDRARRIVMVSGKGILTFQEMTEYQRQVWTRTDLAGYNELADMNHVTEILDDTIKNVEELARISCAMDASIGPTKLAIVASTDFHYGMGRMYKVFRVGHPGCTKEVEVFRAYEDAIRWLSPTGSTDAPPQSDSG
jgi:hypothetical protein